MVTSERIAPGDPTTTRRPNGGLRLRGERRPDYGGQAAPDAAHWRTAWWKSDWESGGTERPPGFHAHCTRASLVMGFSIDAMD
jgi:hypothetical protein